MVLDLLANVFCSILALFTLGLVNPCDTTTTSTTPTSTCLGVSYDDCATQTSEFDTTCFWGKDECRADSAVSGCFTPLPLGTTCESIADKGEDYCNVAYPVEIVPTEPDYMCEWRRVSTVDTCDYCTYCIVIPGDVPVVTRRRDRRELGDGVGGDDGDGTFLSPSPLSLLEEQLFELMIQESNPQELHHYQQKYLDDLHRPNRLGLCDNPKSKHHGDTVGIAACTDTDNYIDGHDADDKEGDDKSALSLHDEEDPQPWGHPNTTMSGTMLAANPGIWLFEDFLNEDEIQGLLQLSKKYGDESEYYGPCQREGKIQLNAHPNVGKTCFKISSQRVCEGPYQTSKCDGQTDAADRALIDSLIKKVQMVWSTNIDPYPYIKFQRTNGGTTPMHLHYDRRTITFIMYLSEGGAGTIFPRVNVTIPPKVGMASTWMNYDRSGKRNPQADHAVQAHPSSAGTRLTASIELRTKSPQQFLESQIL